jgi:gas vesicle protein
MNEQVRNNNLLATFLCGAAVGAGIALLTAPKTGAETRQKLGATARKLSDATRDRWDRARGRFDELREDLKEGVAHATDDMRGDSSRGV